MTDALAVPPVLAEVRVRRPGARGCGETTAPRRLARPVGRPAGARVDAVRDRPGIQPLAADALAHSPGDRRPRARGAYGRARRPGRRRRADRRSEGHDAGGSRLADCRPIGRPSADSPADACGRPDGARVDVTRTCRALRLRFGIRESADLGHGGRTGFAGRTRLAGPAGPDRADRFGGVGPVSEHAGYPTPDQRAVHRAGSGSTGFRVRRPPRHPGHRRPGGGSADAHHADLDLADSRAADHGVTELDVTGPGPNPPGAARSGFRSRSAGSASGGRNSCDRRAERGSCRIPAERARFRARAGHVAYTSRDAVGTGPARIHNHGAPGLSEPAGTYAITYTITHDVAAHRRPARRRACGQCAARNRGVERLRFAIRFRSAPDSGGHVLGG